eukprot:5418069-Prymnesium_polylepis.1
MMRTARCSLHPRAGQATRNRRPSRSCRAASWPRCRTTRGQWKAWCALPQPQPSELRELSELIGAQLTKLRPWICHEGFAKLLQQSRSTAFSDGKVVDWDPFDIHEHSPHDLCHEVRPYGLPDMPKDEEGYKEVQASKQSRTLEPSQPESNRVEPNKRRTQLKKSSARRSTRS